MSPHLNFVSSLPLSARGSCRTATTTRVSPRRAAVRMATISIPTTLKPCSHNIVVKQANAMNETAGGIILPTDAQERPNLGEALDVGPGKFLPNGIKIPMHVAKGDTIIYGKYGGTDLSHDGEDLTVVTQDDVLCKLDGGRNDPDAVQPVFDRLLVRVEEIEEKSSSTIIISDSAKEKPTSGVVVALGPGRFMENGELEPLELAVGDRVYYGQYAGTSVEFDGGDFVILRVSDVFAKL